MKLNVIRDNAGARKERMRVGRGIGSGKGKTAGRGQKGAKARSGVSIAGFEGGQMPLHMRLPKRGFNNIFARDYAEVNIGAIQKVIDAGKLDIKSALDHAALKAAGLARGGRDGVRLLGKGELKAKLAFKVAGVSKGAREAVEKAGGLERVMVERTLRLELAGVDRLLDRADVHLRIVAGEDVVEAALRQPHVERHLAALEAGNADARARLRALLSATRGLAEARADATAHAHAALPGALVVTKFVEFHVPALAFAFVAQFPGEGRGPVLEKQPPIGDSWAPAFAGEQAS